MSIQHWWQLSGDVTETDSVGGVGGRHYGHIPIRPGYSGPCLDFSGTRLSVEAPVPRFEDSDFSIFLRYKPEPTDDTLPRTLISRWSEDSKGWALFIRPDGVLSCKISYDGITEIDAFTLSPSWSVPNEAWEEDEALNRIVLTKSNTELRIYINGALHESVSISSNPFDSSSPLVIGNTNDDDFYGAQGLIDDVRIYDTVLTSSEITDLNYLGMKVGAIGAEYQESDTPIIVMIRADASTPETIDTNSIVVEYEGSTVYDGSTDTFHSPFAGNNSSCTNLGATCMIALDGGNLTEGMEYQFTINVDTTSGTYSRSALVSVTPVVESEEFFQVYTQAPMAKWKLQNSTPIGKQEGGNKYTINGLLPGVEYNVAIVPGVITDGEFHAIGGNPFIEENGELSLVGSLHHFPIVKVRTAQ